MAAGTSKLIRELKQVVHLFDEQSRLRKASLLKKLAAAPLPGGKDLLEYHDLLLFLFAYPDSAGTENLLQYL